ncbi:MAG: hypothetical protein ACREFP_08015 [Acetobacteraceae bacterium]
MRDILLSGAILAGLALAAQPGFAANPNSSNASNLPTSTITSSIAPQLPSTGLGPNATVGQNLNVARSALTAGQTGLAQNALENAATLALTRSVKWGSGNVADSSPLVKNISQALNALGQHDLVEAGHFTDLAIQEAGK